MRIAVISWRDLAHPLAGGSEVLVDRLLRDLQVRGHEVALVCGGPTGLRSYPVYRAGGTFTQYIVGPILAVARFRSFDMIIDVENGLPYFSPLWRRRASICLVHHVHVDQWRTRFPALLADIAAGVERHVFPFVYRKRTFVAVSPSTASALESIGVRRHQIRIIENGVDLPSTELPATSTEPLFVALARLVPHKRVDLLVKAWRIVEPVTGGRLVIIGDGPELPHLRRLATGLSNVEFVGRIGEAEKHRLLGQAWFLVHGSHHEGWGMVILEAAASNTPTLAVDVPGVRDAIVAGETGLLVDAPEEQLPEAIAAAWISLAADAERRELLGRRARRRAAALSWEHMATAWEAVLTEAVSDCERMQTIKRARRQHGRFRGLWRAHTARQTGGG
jgi:glycosyltransferase involved in cell wall biosynthesis